MRMGWIRLVRLGLVIITGLAGTKLARRGVVVLRVRWMLE